MNINLLLILFVILLGLMLSINDSRRQRLLYICLCSAVLIFVAAMRSPEWMTYVYNIDTLNYKHMFESSFDMDWDNLWTLAYQRYFGRGSEEWDIGFIALNKVIGFFTHDFHVFSLLADLIFFVPFGIILYRFTKSIQQIMFAFVFYISLVQVFFFGGARQIFALGFDLMALISVIDKRKIRTIVFFFIGVTIHFSSFIFMVPLFMIWKGVKPETLKFLHGIGFILFPIVLAMPNEIIVFMGETSGMEKYAEYGRGDVQGGAVTFIILIEFLSLFCLLAIKKKDIQSSRVLQCFYVMAPLFTLFAPLIRSNGSMVRISLYFHLFLVLLVPMAIECFFKKKEYEIAYSFVIGTLSLLTISGGMTYYFYWQR